MSSEGHKVKLGDIVDIFTGYPFKSAEYSENPDDIKLIRGDNIAQGTLRWDGVKRWPIDKAEGLDNFLLKENDVLLAMDRPWIPAGLKFARVYSSDLPCLLVQRVACLRAKSGQDQNFIYSLLSTPAFSEYIQNVTTGTAVPHISVKQIKEFELEKLSLETEKEVGFIHEIFESRIKLLRETNSTLEAIAQALFKSWFVDFDPVHANAGTQAPSLPPEIQAYSQPPSPTPQGPIPDGWVYSAISSVVEGLYDGPHATPPEATNGGIFLGIKNLTGTTLDLSDIRYISDQDWDKWTKRITPQQRDIVFSYEATLGFFALVPPKLRCCLGRRLALIRPLPEDGTTHFWFHQFVSAPFQQLLGKHTIQGATVNRIALKSFPSLPVLVPCIEVRKAFESIAGAIWASIHANQAKAQTLTDFRDTLLPHLISGQLRLPEVQAATEEIS